MGYNSEDQRNSNSTALWVVGIVGMLGVLMFGGLVVGGVLWTSHESRQIYQEQVMLEAADQHFAESQPVDQSVDPLTKATSTKTTPTTTTPTTTTRYRLFVTQSGKIELGGEEFDVPGVIARLEEEQRTIHEVLVTADPLCTFKDVSAVVAACHEAGFENVTITSAQQER